MTAPASAGWKPVDGFADAEAYERFAAWVAGEAAAGGAAELPVEDRYAGSNLLHERWFREVSTSRVWRLVAPDFPFAGVFERVDAPTSSGR